MSDDQPISRLLVELKTLYGDRRVVRAMGEAHEVIRTQAARIEALEAALHNISDSWEARSELYTSDVDCAANQADRARAALSRDHDPNDRRSPMEHERDE